MKNMDLNKKIVIGTAQFGMNYGIKNNNGIVSLNEIKKILQYSKQNNILFLDTAISYGQSEYRLGLAGCENHKIISKIPSHVFLNKYLENEISNQILKSISLLNVNSLYGILVHNGNDLLGKKGKEIYKSLINCKRKGLVKKIGISAYNSNEVFEIIKKFEIDIVQIPFNILNRDLVLSGLLELLKEKGIEVHVRSVFLQGLLLMNPKIIPKYFHKWNYLWERWHNWLSINEVKPIEACLKFALDREEIDKIIIGIDNCEQFKEILNITRNNYNHLIPENICSNDEYLINPYYWE